MAKVHHGGTDAGHDHPTQNPAYQACVDAKLAAAWQDWPQPWRAAFVRNGGTFSTLSNHDKNYYDGSLTSEPGGDTAGNYSMADFIAVSNAETAIKAGCASSNP